MTVPGEDWAQVLPETGSDERAHVLDDTCWCGPVLEQQPDGFRFRYLLVHRRPSAPVAMGETK